MRSVAVILAAGVAGLFAFAAEPPKPEKFDDTGLMTIFDGKSLDGWKKSNENQDSIQIYEGEIVANGDRCHLFYVGNDRPFKNFHFVAEVKTKPNSNGGIYFHTKFQEEGWPAADHRVRSTIRTSRTRRNGQRL
jgi:hypothetical protein